jgi:hypothetical protein
MTQEMAAESYLSPRTSQGKTFAVRPRKQPYKPVIGELENRTEYGSGDL